MFKLKVFIAFLTFLLGDFNIGDASWLDPPLDYTDITYSEQNNSINWNNVNSSSTEVAWLVHVNNERGYGIEIDLLGLQLDAESEDYLAIFPSSNFSSSTPGIALLSGTMTNPFKMLIPNTFDFGIKFYSTEERGFNITFGRTGNSLTTDTPPTAPPTQAPEERTYEIILEGRPPEDYTGNFSIELKKYILHIAKNYSENNNINYNSSYFNDELADDNVKFSQISSCLSEWPDSENCAEIIHTIKVNGEENNGEYQLNRTHLQKMWDECKEQNCLADSQLSFYERPSPTNNILWWVLLVGIGVVTAVVGIAGFLKFKDYIKPKTQEKNPIVQDPVVRNAPKMRMSSNQKIPDFMKYGFGRGKPKESSSPTVHFSPENSPSPGAQFSPAAREFGGAIHFAFANGQNPPYEDDEPRTPTA